MTLLTMGMLLFALVHFIPSLTPALKTAAIQRLGENGYKGIFSLLLLAAFALIIIGWRSVQPSVIYTPPLALHNFALGLLAFAFLLLVVTSRKSRLRLFIRHPQLTGVAIWGFSHLLLNGDNRSVVLFGGMLLWAVIEIIVISKREGVWIKTEPPSWGAEVVTVLIAVVTVAVVVAIHPWLSGVAVW
ncbi:MAG: NnrU protein [Haliea sp.]|nr:NnrU protein [Haliea sp.]